MQAESGSMVSSMGNKYKAGKGIRHKSCVVPSLFHSIWVGKVSSIWAARGNKAGGAGRQQQQGAKAEEQRYNVPSSQSTVHLGKVFQSGQVRKQPGK